MMLLRTFEETTDSSLLFSLFSLLSLFSYYTFFFVCLFLFFFFLFFFFFVEKSDVSIFWFNKKVYISYIGI